MYFITGNKNKFLEVKKDVREEVPFKEEQEENNYLLLSISLMLVLAFSLLFVFKNK